MANIGGLPATGTTTVTDTLPAGLSPLSYSSAGWNCTLGSVVTCTSTDTINGYA